MTSNHGYTKRRITIRGQQVTEQDWRGILAVLTTIGYFAILTVSAVRFGFTESLVILGFMSTPETLVLNWYFKAKEEKQ
jgi:hypothetical protein